MFIRKERERKRAEPASEVDMSKLRRRFPEQQEKEETQESHRQEEDAEEYQQDQTQEQGPGELVAEEEGESSFDEEDY